METIRDILNDIEWLGVGAANEFWSRKNASSDNKLKQILALHQRYCMTERLIDIMLETNKKLQTYAEDDGFELRCIREHEKIYWMNPEQLLKDMRLRADRLETLAFVFIP